MKRRTEPGTSIAQQDYGTSPDWYLSNRATPTTTAHQGLF